MTVTSVTVRVPAKINLQLAVGPPRPDGYHGLVTVFHAISLFDELTVAPADADRIAMTGEGTEHIPADADNLALRAATALRAEIAARGGRALAAGRPGVAVSITKRIPVAGGMAGGSADAAAALVACNELWAAGLTAADLCAVGARVGSDVPFAVLGGTAVGRGRGEQLTPVPAAETEFHWVIALADGHLSTPLVYGTLDQLRTGQDIPDPGLSGDLMAALRTGDPRQLGPALSNDLQAPAIALFPALRKTLAAGREFGALAALVSGSGPTCYFLAQNQQHATGLAQALTGADVCRSITQATGPAPGATVLPRP